MHRINGSPVWLGGQVHIGLCLITTHLASTPHEPLQGSIHFWLLQALFKEQSELTKHSGLQSGGLPIKSGIHVHTAWPLTSLHWLFCPHGDGIQGLLISGPKNNKFHLSVTKKILKLFSYFKFFNMLKKQVRQNGSELTSNRFTCIEGISTHSLWTCAHRNVIYYFTNSCWRTCSRTRINTFISYTCFVFCTISTEYTFRSTSNIRIALMFRNAGTNAIITNGICATRWWITFIDYINI